MFKGLGTGGEQWSGVMTQYCEGVSAGAQTCPATAPHVAYPHGGALAGVWVDESAASPAQASGDQLAQEAINAATHFGNTTAADNRDASYVILSPTGTHPDGFNTQTGQDFCAWHDWNGDSTLSGSGAVSSPDGDVAFTNMPYVTDAGVNCGANFVRSGTAGKLDGASIVEGHEYAETITDQNPPGGWMVRLGGRTAPHTDTLAQSVTVAPADGTYGAATFSFWLGIKTNDPASKASDTLTVQVLDASGTVVKQTLHVYSNQDAVGHYVQHSFSLNSFLGQTIVLKFTGAQTLAGHSTSFFIDDTALNAS